VLGQTNASRKWSRGFVRRPCPGSMRRRLVVRRYRVGLITVEKNGSSEIAGRNSFGRSEWQLLSESFWTLWSTGTQAHSAFVPVIDERSAFGGF